eukprot:snap_masked-scaffold_4-processed-gene-9.25-mRNA-1 protein AED:1.00 eAED:1.00 QI:0/-1/0/0/-1/1/1/0/373
MYDPSESETNAITALHVFNDSEDKLSPGQLSIQSEKDGRFLGQAELPPLLPGDEHIISFAEDNAIGVIRTKKSDVDSIELVEMDYEDDSYGGQKMFSSFVLVHKVKRRTIYTMQNNSNYNVETLYLEHKAGADHGGFVILTKGDNVLKDVVGFCRYKFSFAPLEKIEFEVIEEAEYIKHLDAGVLDFKDHSNLLKLIEFQRKEVPNLELQGKFSHDLKELLEKRIKLGRLVKLLKGLSQSSTSNLSSFIKQVQKLDDIDAKIKKYLTSYEQTTTKIKENEREKKFQTEKEVQVVRNIERLRQNIKSMEAFSGNALVKRYSKELDNAETVLSNHRDSIDKLNALLYQQNEELKGYVTQVREIALKELAKIHPKL